MERDYIDWLRETLPTSTAVEIGIGDDAAILAPWGDASTVVTTDLLADGTHFLTAETDPRLIGRKCLAANLSDLAAMAADPEAVFVSLLLPRSGAGGHDTSTLAKRITEGMLPLAAEFGVAIAGGDTNVWEGRLAVSITAMGKVSARGPLTRAGAQVGDRLLLTGELGGSIEGHHLTFAPRVREAQLLNQRYTLHAGMDITDGLAVDLSRLAAASGVGAQLRASDIPPSPAAQRLATASGGDPLDHALGDGEDFELLLAVPPADAAAILREQPLECGVTEIGELIDQGMWIVEASGERRNSQRQGIFMADQKVTLRDESDTHALGAALAKVLSPGSVVSLVGTLGAGKTRLVQAVAEALGIDREEVTSPTFVLVNEYTTGRLPVYHFDAYRLRDDDEFLELGPEEYFAGLAGKKPGITFVEWGDRVADCLPAECIVIEMEVVGETGREVKLSDPGGLVEQTLQVGPTA